jgi:rhodanese-related sulfurtransferase
LVFSSCKSDNDEPTDPGTKSNYEVLTTYLVDQNLDLPVIITDWIVAPPAEADLATFLATYDFIDVRAAADFALGHIDGAINSPLAGVLTAAANTTKPIVVVCYTGQSAGHATAALRLSGYPDTKVLLWGMSGWAPEFSSPWEANSGDNGNIGVGNANWVAANVTPIPVFTEPTLTTTGTDGASMLADRVQTMLDNGFKGISSADVLADPEANYINNFWAQEDIDKYGCINSTYRIKPLSITDDLMKYYDPNKTAVTYCWTGQTSSMVTAYLNVIGYNAVSLKFGANSMIYSDLEAHKFVTPAVSLPVVTE